MGKEAAEVNKLIMDVIHVHAKKLNDIGVLQRRDPQTVRFFLFWYSCMLLLGIDLCFHSSSEYNNISVVPISTLYPSYFQFEQYKIFSIWYLSSSDFNIPVSH